MKIDIIEEVNREIKRLTDLRSTKISQMCIEKYEGKILYDLDYDRIIKIDKIIETYLYNEEIVIRCETTCINCEDGEIDEYDSFEVIYDDCINILSIEEVIKKIDLIKSKLTKPLDIFCKSLCDVKKNPKQVSKKKSEK